ncbi:MAG: hypothetical protein COB66_00515 [Coxiella sp. (in: Bacteria)]|nr:MAG: hypothetical protein COB66_00515 [Coxiella sp. (in: g-proteobacteria)]
MRRRFLACWVILICLLLGACAPAPPRNPTNACGIFFQYPKWYWAAKKSQKKWGVPISVQLAIIHQESHFRADAKPARRKILWVIPWTRPTTAEGYAQAVNGTWRLYLQSTGRSRADRANFDSATDFVGWFAYRVHRRFGISRNNAYALYLAYHEGPTAYSRRSYLRKPWLMRVARKVAYHANRYRAQLAGCASRIPKHHWWNF